MPKKQKKICNSNKILFFFLFRGEKQIKASLAENLKKHSIYQAYILHMIDEVKFCIKYIS
jgi:ribosomal protein S26